MLLTDIRPEICFMLGAIVGSTSPAVIVPLVRHLRIRSDSSTLLILESALSDVLSIIVALAFLEWLRLGELRFGLLTGRMISSFLLAIMFGIVGGFVWSILLNKMRPLRNAMITTPAFVFVIFGIVDTLGYSGYVAALAFGITLGNIELFDIDFLERYMPHEPIALNNPEKVFFAEVVFLLQTFFFVYVGLSIQLTNQWWIFFGLVLTFLIFLLRIPVVRFSIRKSTPKTDAAYMAVMVPKGLAAAVLASIPFQQGVGNGDFV